jgi:hypothetical protein
MRIDPNDLQDTQSYDQAKGFYPVLLITVDQPAKKPAQKAADPFRADLVSKAYKRKAQ